MPMMSTDINTKLEEAVSKEDNTKRVEAVSEDNTKREEAVSEGDNTKQEEAVSKGNNTEFLKAISEVANTKLMETVSKSDNTKLEEAISEGDNTKLHEAVSKGDNSKHAKADSEGNNTKLEKAISDGDVQLVKDLISSGADVNFVRDYKGTPLNKATVADNIDIVRELIRCGADVNLVDPFYKSSPLHSAARIGRVEIAKELIKNHADVTELDSGFGMTPLHCALNAEHLDIAKYLIRYVADVNAIKDRENRSALHIVAMQGNVQIFQELMLRHADVHMKDKQGLSSLHLAARNGHLEILRGLIEFGADVNATDCDCKTPMHLAAAHAGSEVIRDLVQYGACVDARDCNGRSPLYLAVEMAERMGPIEGCIEPVKELIRCRADIGIRDNKGMTVLHFLLLENISNTENLKLLCDHEHLLNAPDHYGRTVLHNTISLGYHRVVKILLSYAGIDVNTKDVFNQTPLHFAIPIADDETIDRLLNTGCDFKVLDNMGRSVLHLAAIYGHASLIDAFIEKGLDPNATDKYGRNSLHYAVMYRQDEVVKLLLPKMTNCEVKDLSGMAPRDYLHQCEQKCPTFQLLNGETVNTLVFALDEDQTFCSVITHTPHLAELCRVPGIGSVQYINEFNMKDFIKIFGDEINDVICEAIPELAGPRADSALLRMGSCTEGSKVGLPDEIDFLIQLFHLGGANPINQEGYQDISSASTGFISRQYYLDIEGTYSVWLWTKLMAYWNKHWQVNQDMPSGEGQFLMPTPPQRHPERTTCVTWVWLYSNEIFKSLPVSIDLVPAMGVQKGNNLKDQLPMIGVCREEANDPITSTTLMTKEERRRREIYSQEINHSSSRHFRSIGVIYLVPKIPHQKSKICEKYRQDELKRLGRISYPIHEVHHLSKIDQQLKDVYITAKCLRKPEVSGFKVKDGKGKIHHVGEYITSYRLKTVFLHLVDVFQKSSMSYGRMVLLVYEQMVSCLEREYLPMFFDTSINVLAGSRLDTTDCCKVARVMTEFVRSVYERDFQYALNIDAEEVRRARTMLPKCLPK